MAALPRAYRASGEESASAVDVEANESGSGSYETGSSDDFGDSCSDSSDAVVEERLKEHLAPATIRILKLLKHAEKEMNREPTAEELQAIEDMNNDYSWWGYAYWSGYKVFSGAEWMGEKIAHVMGITAPKYEYYIEHAIRLKEEVSNPRFCCRLLVKCVYAQEKLRREKEFAARTAALEELEGGAARGVDEEESAEGVGLSAASRSATSES